MKDIMSGTPHSNYLLLSFDVEDWFQVENFKQWIPLSSWSSFDLRVEKNTHCILDLLDTITLPSCAESCCPHPQKKNTPRATFFVLGWIAKRLPQLVREIQTRGHEVASHGYGHALCDQERLTNLTEDLADSKRLIEDTLGVPVYGYRAPSFSISSSVLEVIQKSGYSYDSSFNSFGAHSRYGKLELSRCEKVGIAVKISDTFHELPISNLRIRNRIIPWGGGGYFRLIPQFLFRAGVQSILKRDGAYLFYLHPWEIDPGQPRVRRVSRKYRFRHYVNLRLSLERLRAFIRAFQTCRFVSCHDYLRLLAREDYPSEAP